MEPGEIAEVGQKLIELGMELKEKRAARDELDTEIKKLEAEVMPLMQKQQQFMTELLGVPAPAGSPGGPAVRPGAAEEAPDPNLKKRIKLALGRMEPGVGPIEVAEALKLDAAMVRSVMMEMAREARDTQSG
jgi:septal ring factor EnvC (AmiA/AmiB activator)